MSNALANHLNQASTSSSNNNTTNKPTMSNRRVIITSRSSSPPPPLATESSQSKRACLDHINQPPLLETPHDLPLQQQKPNSSNFIRQQQLQQQMQQQIGVNFASFASMIQQQQKQDHLAAFLHNISASPAAAAFVAAAANPLGAVLTMPNIYSSMFNPCFMPSLQQPSPLIPGGAEWGLANGNGCNWTGNNSNVCFGRGKKRNHSNNH